MGLTINVEKSRKVKAREQSFDFLGFTFRYDRSIFNRERRFWNIFPKKESQKKIRQKINARLKVIGHLQAELIPWELNPIIRGWMNYYKIDKVSYTQVAFKKLDDYLRVRLYRYYNRKSQRRSNLHGQQAYELLANSSISELRDSTCECCKAKVVGKPYAGKPHSLSRKAGYGLKRGLRDSV